MKRRLEEDSERARIHVGSGVDVGVCAELSGKNEVEALSPKYPSNKRANNIHPEMSMSIGIHRKARAQTSTSKAIRKLT